MTRLRMLLPALVLGALLALGAFSAACGGDDNGEDGDEPTATAATEATEDAGDEPTDEPADDTSEPSSELEAYFAEVEALGQSVDEDAAEAFDTLNTSQDLDELQAAYAVLPELFSTFLDGMKDVDAPDEVTDEHDAAISASENFLAELESANDAVQDATTIDEYNAASDTPELSQLNSIVAGTCDDLQAIADANNIVADLGCDV